VDDVPSLRSATEADAESGVKKLGKKWIANRIAHSQKHSLSRVNGGWVSCQEDLEILKDDRFAVLPNIPFDALQGSANSSWCVQNVDSRVVLFVGAMNYSINVQAVSEFLDNVWSIIVEKLPNAVFRIVGGGVSVEMRKQFARSPNVQIAGFVDDLQNEYRKCALSIVPINGGAGTKIKVLESLRFGRTVVLTEHSLRGYTSALENGRDVCVADAPNEIAMAVVDLLQNPGKRESMAKSGQAVVNDHFGFDRFANVVAARLDRCA
jgi:glycosyltransferase involved in cell wall biosynthesis